MKALTRTIFSFLLVAAATGITAQTTDSIKTDRHRWENIIEEMSDYEEMSDGYRENMYDELCALESHPLNINTAEREDLERIPFLTEQQIMDIVEYKDRFGRMESLGELMMIGSLDYFRRRLLECFIVAGESRKKGFPSLKEIAKRGKHNLMISAKVPLYDREGDKHGDDGEESGYMGYKYRHTLRYSFTCGDYLKAGITGGQDAGEPFFADRNKWGYDHYSYYLLVRNLGIVKTLALGSFKISTGMGLVMNSNFALGKIMTLSSLGRNNNGIKANASRSDGYYLEGAAVTIEPLRHLYVTAFASYRKMDGTLKGDSAVSSIYTNGYHRTMKEMQKKHVLGVTTLGGNVKYRTGRITLGITGVHTSLDKRLSPNTKTLYKRNYMQGYDFWNIGADYSYASRKISFMGETATCNNGALATINNLSVNMMEKIDLVALQRFYSCRYTTFYGNSFSDGGSVQNESGVYLGMNYRPTRNLTMNIFTDFAYFPWARYQVSASSRSSDNMISATLNQGKWIVTGRYRLKLREKDNDDKTQLIIQQQHKARLAATYNPSEAISITTQGDYTCNKYKKKDSGWMISENVALKKEKLKLNAYFAYFNTSGSGAMIYAYERGMLYEYSFPAYYGEGIRYSLMASLKITKDLMTTVKASTTDYFDRNSISSGLQEIKSSAITDLEMQIRWSF